jgi:hypothetical protein
MRPLRAGKALAGFLTLPRTVALLLTASLLLGLGHIALLPPWEGFDETGHYSYIQQVAATGRWTRPGDMMSKDIDDYLKLAPASENVPLEWTYHQFFGAGPTIIARGRQAVHEAPAVSRSFAPGRIGNWQAQHPPLYYYLMAPAYLLSNGWSLGAQLFLLRAFSYLIAWGALAILVIVALRRFRHDERVGMLLPLALGLWPVMFPMWFPEIARIGNDSLIVLFAACTLLLLDRAARQRTMAQHALLGATLGLALLTKATFLPVAAAVAAVLAGLTWSARARPDERARRLKGLGLCLLLAACISVWWYAGIFVETGSLIGSNDVAKMTTPGGMLSELGNALTRYRVMLTAWVLATSFLWYGTWSFVQPPWITMVPFFGLVAMLLFGAWCYYRQRGGLRLPDWLALLTLLLFLVALGYHSVILLIATGNPAPTWYLHSLSPILALLVGCGIAGAAGVTWLRGLMTFILVYALIFLPAATFLNVLFFAGCAPLIPGRRYFRLDEGVGCLMDLPRIYNNLNVLTMPSIGIVFFLGGSIAMFAGATAALRHLPALGNRKSRMDRPA